MKTTLLAALIMASPMAFAQTPVVNQQCPTGDTGSCTNQNQMRDNISSVTGDTTAPVSSSQQGVASASNASGNSINPNIHVDPQVSQNSTNATTGTINGTNTNGNDHASATGGSAIGNDSKNDNRSSIGDTSTGASTATNGNNSNGANTNGSNSNGANTNTSLTGGNTMTGGANTATNTANGGAGGLGGTGGQGGTGGSSTSSSGGNTMSNGSNSGGNALGQSSKTSNDGSGNSSTHVDASDRSVYNNKTIFIPSVVPATPPSHLAVGNIVKETSACGPLQAISKREIKGTFHGIFSTSEVLQGFHQELVPYIDVNGVEQQYKNVPLPTGDGYRVFGHQVTQYTTVVGVSGARNIAIGGGGSSGSWGQGGMGTSSANQQLVTTLQLRLCEIGTVKYPQVVKMIEVERKPKKN